MVSFICSIQLEVSFDIVLRGATISLQEWLQIVQASYCDMLVAAGSCGTQSV